MTSDALPNAMLVGRPGGMTIPERERIRWVHNLQEPVKVFCGNRYEHFHPTLDTVKHPLGLLRVFAWTRTTYVAE